MDAVKAASFILVLMQIFWFGDTQRTIINACELCALQRSSCRQVTGIFTVTRLSKGYNPVIDIPAGACNINITELGTSDNFLALKTSSGRDIVNNLWSLDSPGRYDGAGTVFNYKRGEVNCPGECVYTKGPLSESVIVQLLYYSINPGIGYSFQLPPNIPESAIGKIVPKIEEHHRRRKHRHRHHHNQSYTSGLTSAERMEIVALKQGDTHRSSRKQYNVDSGPYTGDRASATRASARSRSQTYPIYDRNSHLHHVQQPQYVNPYNRRYSQNQALTDRTFSRGFSEDRYELERPTHVAGQQSSRPNTVEIPIPDASSETRVNSVDAYEWITRGFSECSHTCGGGVQQTLVACISTSNRIMVTEENCDKSVKPNTQYIVCSTEPCTPDWEVQDWSSCSQTCGFGQQTRRIECKQRISATLTISVSATNCRGPMPATVQQCQLQRCAHWATGEWSKCSVDCGIGERRRRVHCRDGDARIVSDSECRNELTVPVSMETCDMGSCTRLWFFSKWSDQCSSDCGSGAMTRHVHCATETGEKSLDSYCDSSKKPVTEKTCQSDVPCGGKWFTGPWSKCSVSCGRGIKRRDVVCVKKISDSIQTVVADNNCIVPEKPSMQDDCYYQNCSSANWYMTEWTRCSVTCGGGQKRRYVRCLDEEQRPSTKCSDTDKPADKYHCNDDRCWVRPTPSPKVRSHCRDKFPNCRVAVQARLCRFPYYQRKCCASCSAGNV